ncbi:alpha/beta fold hydrolase, partial [Streptomyces lydicus]|uniref:alpha/beta fold hydrolase n=1 Tax=Streptomyces lydicus TaxID=47763 RepID=UPI0037AC3A75
MAATAFHTAYEEAMARWPVPVERREVVTEFGTTRVNVCGAADGPPLVLLPGGGTSSAVWHALAAALAPAHRLYAVDQMGAPGLSVPGGRRVRRPADLPDWLDGVLDGLGLASAALLGHSYGGWVALRHAVHSTEAGPAGSFRARGRGGRGGGAAPAPGPGRLPRCYLARPHPRLHRAGGASAPR